MKEIHLTLTKVGELPMVIWDSKRLSFSRKSVLQVADWNRNITIHIEDDNKKTRLVVKGCRRKEIVGYLDRHQTTVLRLEDGGVYISYSTPQLQPPTDSFSSLLATIVLGETPTVREQEEERSKKTSPPADAFIDVKGVQGW